MFLISNYIASYVENIVQRYRQIIVNFSVVAEKYPQLSIVHCQFSIVEGGKLMLRNIHNCELS